MFRSASLTLFLLLLSVVCLQLVLSEENSEENSKEDNARALESASGEDKGSGDDDASGSGSGDGDGKKAGGVSLGSILGIMFLVCCILYAIGIGYKIFKITKGTYVEEDPVFLKYK